MVEKFQRSDQRGSDVGVKVSVTLPSVLAVKNIDCVCYDGIKDKRVKQSGRTRSNLVFLGKRGCISCG